MLSNIGYVIRDRQEKLFKVCILDMHVAYASIAPVLVFKHKIPPKKTSREIKNTHGEENGTSRTSW